MTAVHVYLPSCVRYWSSLVTMWLVLVTEVRLLWWGLLHVRVGAGSPSAVQRAWKVWSPLELTVMLMILGAAAKITAEEGK